MTRGLAGRELAAMAGTMAASLGADPCARHPRPAGQHQDLDYPKVQVPLPIGEQDTTGWTNSGDAPKRAALLPGSTDAGQETKPRRIWRYLPEGVMAKISRRKLGILLCLGAVATLAGGWGWARSSAISTDNAYIRGDVTSLAPKVGGYVTTVEVEDNQAVRAGDVLFRIDDRDYRARLSQAVANVRAAEARLTNVDAEIQLQHALVRQAEAQHRATLAELDLATRASDRRRELIRSNVVSHAQLDESNAARSRAEAGVSAAFATLEAQQQRIAVLTAQREAAVAARAQAEAASDLAEIDLDSTIVRAPIGGIIGNRQVRLGRLVAPGVSLLDIVPVDDVWIVANFKETQLGSISLGQRVRITVDGYPNETLEGVVDSLAPGSGSAFSLLPSDNATGNFVRVVQRVPVKIRFTSNPMAGRLVPGLSARVEIDRRSGS